MELQRKNYMKYWRVVRRYALCKYNLTQEDLDVLFYIHDEVYFSAYKFGKLQRLLQWDYSRLNRLSKDGWLVKLTPGNKYGKKDVYEITIKTSRVVCYLYDILNGTGFPSPTKRMTKKSKLTMDRNYRIFIGNLVDEIKQKKIDDAANAQELIKQEERDARIRALNGR